MKGVSPVIATVLMVAVAIAAAVVLYSWIMSTTASTTTQASSQAGTIGKYNVRIESAECDASTNTVRLWLRNESDVDIDDNFTYTIQKTDGSVIDTNVQLIVVKAGEVNNVSISSHDLQANERIAVVLKGPSGIAISTDQPITCQ
jgi:flagellin-like protein